MIILGKIPLLHNYRNGTELHSINRLIIHHFALRFMIQFILILFNLFLNFRIKKRLNMPVLLNVLAAQVLVEVSLKFVSK